MHYKHDGSDDNLWDNWHNSSYDQLHAMLTRLRDRAETRGYSFYAELYKSALLLLEDADIQWQVRYEEIINTLRRGGDTPDDLIGKPEDDL